MELGSGVLAKTPEVFAREVGDQPALIVADETTFDVAGRTVLEAFRRAKRPVEEPFMCRDPRLYAETGSSWRWRSTSARRGHPGRGWLWHDQ